MLDNFTQTDSLSSIYRNKHIELMLNDWMKLWIFFLISFFNLI